MHVFFSICFTQMSMFSFHILFLYLLLQKMEDFCLFYALASMIFYSRSRIVCNVFISDIFEIFYAFLCILCILIQGTMVEQLCLNGFTLYKYICNKIKKVRAPPLYANYFRIHVIGYLSDYLFR